MNLHPLIDIMPPTISELTYAASSPYANVGAEPVEVSSSKAEPSSENRPEHYKSGKKEMIYAELMHGKNEAARTRIKKDNPDVMYATLRHEKDAADGAIYAEVNKAAKPAKQAKPSGADIDVPPPVPPKLIEAGQAMFEAREVLSVAVGDMVRKFATSIPRKSLFNRDTSTYGSGAAVAALVRDLVGGRFGDLAHGLGTASLAAGQDSYRKAEDFVGRSVYAMTTQAISALSEEENKTLKSHLKGGKLLTQAFLEAEPTRSSGAADQARASFLRALSDNSA